MVNTILSESAFAQILNKESQIALDESSTTEQLQDSFSRVYDAAKAMNGRPLHQRLHRLCQAVSNLYHPDIRDAVVSRIEGKSAKQLVHEYELEKLEKQIDAIKVAAKQVLGVDIAGGVLDLTQLPETTAAALFTLLDKCDWGQADYIIEGIDRTFTSRKDTAVAVKEWQNFWDHVDAYLDKLDAERVSRVGSENEPVTCGERRRALHALVIASSEGETDGNIKQGGAGCSTAPQGGAEQAGVTHSAPQSTHPKGH
jgi:hypothetical protein